VSPQWGRWVRRLHLGTIAGVLVAGYIAIYLVDTVKHNYEMQREITHLNEEIANLKVEQDQLRYKIQYYQTDSYKEKEARAKLGLQAPGEGVVILPHDDTAQAAPASPAEAQPHKSNWQQWMDFLLGRT
jgi:cell division protein FtsB